jgi:hypothetical protein
VFTGAELITLRRQQQQQQQQQLIVIFHYAQYSIHCRFLCVFFKNKDGIDFKNGSYQPGLSKHTIDPTLFASLGTLRDIPSATIIRIRLERDRMMLKSGTVR